MFMPLPAPVPLEEELPHFHNELIYIHLKKRTHKHIKNLRVSKLNNAAIYFNMSVTA